MFKHFFQHGYSKWLLIIFTGRSDFAHSLAALLLTPYLKPPITVGISGSWGMGKSSLMIQVSIKSYA